MRPDDLLTRDELAERLKLSPRTVTAWTNTGDLPARWLRSRAYYDWEEVKAAMVRRTTSTPAPGVGTGGYVSPLNALRGGASASRTKKTGSRG